MLSTIKRNNFLKVNFLATILSLVFLALIDRADLFIFNSLLFFINKAILKVILILLTLASLLSFSIQLKFYNKKTESYAFLFIGGMIILNSILKEIYIPQKFFSPANTLEDINNFNLLFKRIFCVLFLIIMVFFYNVAMDLLYRFIYNNKNVLWERKDNILTVGKTPSDSSKYKVVSVMDLRKFGEIKLRSKIKINDNGKIDFIPRENLKEIKEYFLSSLNDYLSEGAHYLEFKAQVRDSSELLDLFSELLNSFDLKWKLTLIYKKVEDNATGERTLLVNLNLRK